MNFSSSSPMIRSLIGCEFPLAFFQLPQPHCSLPSYLRRANKGHSLPGVPPTYRKAEIPFTAVVNIRGDRLYHEHISWDQGTVLVQLGLMPEYLPFPHPITKGTTSKAPDHLEYRVPVAGIDSALKMRDRNSLPSNEMFKFKTREVSQSGEQS